MKKHKEEIIQAGVGRERIAPEHLMRRWSEAVIEDLLAWLGREGIAPEH
jgi:hypothetical protein